MTDNLAQIIDNQYDVFLCHNSKDKEEVKKIGEQLKEWGLLPWLDEWDLRPGLSLQEQLEETIKKIKSKSMRSAAVFVGSNGLGPWQKREMEAFISLSTTTKYPLIPVLLSTTTQQTQSELSIFITSNMWVDFRQQEPDPMKQLIWGITEIKPEEQIPPLSKILSDYKHPLKDYLNEFQIIFEQISDNSAIASAYKNIFPDDIPPNKDKIINNLIVNDDKNSEILLIVKFANQLATNLEIKKNSLFQDIRNWLNKIPDEFKIKITDSNEDEYNSQEIYTYLLIIVDAQANNKFQLNAEYILEDENSSNIKQEALNLPGNNEQNGILCDSFNEIPNLIKKYYDELYNQLSGNELKHITVELFLPIQYLRNNLDKEWFCDDDFDGKTPIVRECNIVVRSSNRINNNKFRILLQNNFKRFKDSLSKYSDEDILNKEIEIIHQKVVDSNFQEISEKFKDKKVGVKLNHDSVPQTAFFKAILRGAIVIAFWRRDSNHEDSNLYDIDNYLKLELLNNNFHDFIKQMYELRKKASYSDGNCSPIGFLCDNPNRIPKIKHLQSF